MKTWPHGEQRLQAIKNAIALADAEKMIMNLCIFLEVTL